VQKVAGSSPVEAQTPKGFKSHGHRQSESCPWKGWCYVLGVSLDDEEVTILKKLLGNEWNKFRRNEFDLFDFMYKQTWYVDWISVRVTYIQS